MRGLSPRWLVSRLAQTLPTVAGILLLVFALLHFAPGDPVLALAGEHGDPDYYETMRARFGLDRPLPERLAVWTGRVVRGDLGHSYVQGRPVLEVIGERVPATLVLAGTALALSTLLGLLTGMLAAWRSRRTVDAVVTTGALVLYASPGFWLGQMAILFLGYHAGLFPIQGMTTAGSDAEGLARALDVARHLALPALVLAAHEAAAVTRLVRQGLLAELERDYVRTARAKGVGEWRVYTRHALPRTLLPVVTVVGHRVGRLLAGTVLVEVVFAWPGLGRLLLDAVLTRDLPILMGLFLVVAVSVVIANLLTDLAYAALDPRVRHA